MRTKALEFTAVEAMIRAWQEECAAFPAIYNQGNVLLGRLADMMGDQSDILAVDFTDEEVSLVRRLAGLDMTPTQVLRQALSIYAQEPVAWRYRDAWGNWAYCRATDNINGPTVITEKQALYALPSPPKAGE